MPTPITGFTLADPKSDGLGWNLTTPQRSINATLWINNQSEFDFDIWGDGSTYLGRVPAWMIYVPLRLPLIFTTIAFRNVQSLFVQSPVSETVDATLYEATEPPPLASTPIALPRQSSQIRQERQVCVPIGLSHFYTNFWNGSGVSVLATFFPTAAQKATRHAGLYLYYARRDCYFQATVGADAFAISTQWRDSGGVAIGAPFDLAIGRMSVSTTTGDHWVLAPMAPLANIGLIPVGGDHVDLEFRSLGGSTLDCAIMVCAFMDPANTANGDGEIGFGQIWTPQSFEQAGQPFPFY